MEGDPIGAQLVALAEQLNNPAPAPSTGEQDGQPEHQGFYWEEAAPATPGDEPAQPSAEPQHPAEQVHSVWEPVSSAPVEPNVASQPQPAVEPNVAPQPQPAAEARLPAPETADTTQPPVEALGAVERDDTPAAEPAEVEEVHDAEPQQATAAHVVTQSFADMPQPTVQAAPAVQHDDTPAVEVHDAEPVAADEPPASVEVVARPGVSEAAAEVASRLDALEAAAAQPMLADSPGTALGDVSTAEQLLTEAAQLAQMDAQIVIKQAEIAAAGLVAKAREEAARITEQARLELSDARREAELTVNRARAQSDQILAASQVRADELLDQARDLSEVARVAMQTVQSAADRAAGELSRAHRTITSQLNSDSVQSELRLTEIDERSQA